MEEEQSTEIKQNKKKHGPLIFVVAGLSLVPLIGVVFGIVCILTAAISRKSNSLLLGSIGVVGILVTVVLYGVILPSKFNDPEFSKKFEPHAKSAMTSIIRHVEYFKLQNSRYPKSMEELKTTLKEGELVFMHDVSAPGKFGEQRDFFYKVVNEGNNYLLLGVGVDGIPLTNDDIYPLIDPEKDKAIGWVQSE